MRFPVKVHHGAGHVAENMWKHEVLCLWVAVKELKLKYCKKEPHYVLHTHVMVT